MDMTAPHTAAARIARIAMLIPANSGVRESERTDACPLSPPQSHAAFTYEHIPATIAHDLRSAPRSMSLLGFIGRPPAPPAVQADEAASTDTGSDTCAGCSAACAAGGVLLGQWQYNVHSTHAVQTFAVDSPALPAGGSIDHVRLVVSSNWGHPGYTCLYRLRMHGTPAVPVPAATAA